MTVASVKYFFIWPNYSIMSSVRQRIEQRDTILGNTNLPQRQTSISSERRALLYQYFMVLV
eukprot:UN24347